MSDYNYFISTDTLNARVNIKDLQSEVNSSSIVTTLNSISTDSDELTFEFNSTLSSGDETTLTAIINAHQAIIPEDVVVDPVIQISSQPAFAAKITTDGKKLYKRIHGKKYTLTVGSNTLEFTVPYNQCKINGVEIINATLGDTSNFKVADTTTGTYSTVPNYELNQFGYDVNLRADYHEEISNYDADLYLNMVVKIEVESVDAKDIYINYILHEVK